MSIFKPSVANPNLQEINLDESNVFTCQINTTGEAIKAYKLTILSEKGDEVLYDGEVINVGDPDLNIPPLSYPKSLSVPVNNKKTLNIPIESYEGEHIAKVGTPFYEDRELTIRRGLLTEDDSREYHLSKDENTGKINNYSEVESINYPGQTLYIRTPDINFIPETIINGKNYQWGVRVYNNQIGSITKPNTTVCTGFLVGSTKYIVWSEIENTNTVALDPVVYDRYIEFNIPPEETSEGSGEYVYKKLILGANEDPSVTIPTPKNSSDNYIERKKIDWVTKELGKSKNYIKIETTEDFKYNFADGTPYHIYKCSSDHTVTSVYADPNSNINLSNYIMIYANAQSAKNGFEHGENPKTSVDATGLIYPARKVTGYSSDTGEIRVDDAFKEAPLNGQAYRIFEYNSATQLYTELFTSDLVFEVPIGQICYSTILPASTDSKKFYYYDTYEHMQAGGETGKVENAEQTNVDFAVNSENGPYYYFSKKGSTYYARVDQMSNPLTLKVYNASDVNQYRGIITQEDLVYYVQYSSLVPKFNGETLDSPFDAQVVGGRPIDNDSYVVLSNKVDNSIKRIFIQPNINIKTDDTNYNQIVFENDARIGIKKQLEYNNTTRKWNDITFEKLDNTQWMLQGESIVIYDDPQIDIPTDKYGNIRPQTSYTVYTDFMDMSPYNLFYARKAPNLVIKYRNSIDKIIKGTLIDFDTFLSSDGEYINDTSNLYLYYDVNTNLYYRWDAMSGEFQLKNSPWKYLNEDTVSEDNPAAMNEIEFKAVWINDDEEEIEELPFSIKNYQYTLYAYDRTANQGYFDKEIIKQSGVIYNNELTWTFKGFDGTRYESGYDWPHKYTIVLDVIDEYDKEHSKDNDIYIKYAVQESSQTIDISLDCDNHALDVEVGSLTYAITVDTGPKLKNRDPKFKTVTNDNIIEDGENPVNNYLNIPSGKILNYRKLVAENADIAIQNTMTFFAQFNITQAFAEDFEGKESSSPEKLVLSFCHDLNYDGSYYPPDETSAEYEYIELRLNIMPENYIGLDGELHNNPDHYCLKLYRNGELINTFVMSDGTKKDKYNIVYPENNLSLSAPNQSANVLYAIQSVDGEGVYNSYSIERYLNNPNIVSYDPQTYYIIQNDSSIEIPGGINKKGVYHLSGSESTGNLKWEYVKDSYIIFNNINDIGKTYDELQVPMVCRGEDGELRFETDSEELESPNLLWVDNIDPRIESLYNKWINIYIVIDNSGRNENISTYIDIE